MADQIGGPTCQHLVVPVVILGRPAYSRSVCSAINPYLLVQLLCGPCKYCE